jgi:hypothetical protein
MVNKFLLFAGLCSLSALQLNAQTINDFEDVILASPATTYLADKGIDGTYTYTSGQLILNGDVKFGATFYTGINCSNYTDTIPSGHLNSWSAVTGAGFNQSANYSVVYLDAVAPNWISTEEKAIIIDPNSTDKKFNGLYITNTTWAYDYISNNYQTGDSFSLVIRAYKNNAATDSIVYNLAHYGAQLSITKDWHYLNLNKLGIVDSITLQLVATDDYTPFYVAIDNIITSDGICENIDSAWVQALSHSTASIAWNNAANNANYEIAIDTFSANAPDAQTSITTTNQTSNEFIQLQPNTNYQVYIRNLCNNGNESDWTILKLTTKANGIASITYKHLKLSPNPANDYIYFHTQLAEVSIYNLKGQQVKHYTNVENIHIAALNNGLYYIMAKDSHGTQYATKLIKQ